MAKHSGWGPRNDEQPAEQKLNGWAEGRSEHQGLLPTIDHEEEFDRRFSANVAKLKLNPWFSENFAKHITHYWEKWFEQAFAA
jgi:hypothetical protein